MEMGQQNNRGSRKFQRIHVIWDYLGFTFNKKGNYVDHIKELNREGRIAANRI